MLHYYETMFYYFKFDLFVEVEPGTILVEILFSISESENYIYVTEKFRSSKNPMLFEIT